MAGNNDKANHSFTKVSKSEADTRKRRNHSKLSGGGADWATCNGELLAKAVAAIARDGGALRLGYTRDGGAYAVGIYGDGDPFTEYVPPSDDIDEYLRGVIEDYGK
jgi:hypothetical protein